MENIIYNELKIRGYQVDVGEIEVNERGVDGKNKEKKVEVDFVVNQGSRRYYIQSAYDLPTPEKWAQEEKNHSSISVILSKKIVITQGIKQPYYNEKRYYDYRSA